MQKILKKNKPLVITGAVLLLVLVAYFSRNRWLPYFQKLNTNSTSPTNASLTITAPTSSPPMNTSTSLVTDDTLLYKGIKAKDKVKELQMILNQKLQETHQLPLLVVDGIFGKNTQATLRQLTNRTSISINELKALLGVRSQANSSPYQYTWN